MIPDPEPLMTTAEVARYWRVSPATVGRWCRAGLLTSVWTPGRRRRFKASEVEALLAASAS